MPDHLTFAALIRAARQRLGLDLQAAAAASQCSESYISLIETGKRLPSEDLAVRLARSLAIDPTEALLALVRCRLPEAQRQALDPISLVRDASTQLAVMRELLAAQLRSRIDSVSYECVVDWDGSARVTLGLTGLRPAPGLGPLKELVFHDPLGSSPVKPRVLESPPGLHFELESTPWNGGLAHALSFPEGWSAGEGPSLSFELSHTRREAFALDLQSTLAARGRVGRNHASAWSFAAFASTLVSVLTLRVLFPEGYRPLAVSPWSWLGNAPFEIAADNLIDSQVARAREFHSRGSRHELKLVDPLPLYSYALVWSPPDRLERIDAQRGLSAAGE